MSWQAVEQADGSALLVHDGRVIGRIWEEERRDFWPPEHHAYRAQAFVVRVGEHTLDRYVLDASISGTSAAVMGSEQYEELRVQVTRTGAYSAEAEAAYAERIRRGHRG